MNKTNRNEPSKLTRNIFLTILLVLILIANTFVGFIFLLNIAGIADGAYVTMTPPMVLFSFLVCIGNIICGYAIWYWRKWGMIGYGVIVVTAFFVTGIVTKDFSNFYSLVGLIILSILIYPYWKFMK